MTSFYFAGRFSRGPELIPLARELEARGHLVTARWITGHGGELARAFTPEQLQQDPQACQQYALVDLEDIIAADTVVHFTDQPGGKGGRHTEFGYALALNRRNVLIGNYEHVFHTMTDAIYPSFDKFLLGECP